MKARVALAVYAGVVIVLASTHDVRVLAAAAALWVVLARRDGLRIARKAFLATGLFTGTVTIAALGVGLYHSSPDWAWALRTNLRVLTITAITLWTFERVDLARALAPWSAASTLLVVAGAQIRLLQREYDDLRLGLASRTTRRPGAMTVARHAGGAGAHFLGRAMHDAEEIGLAMQARGVWRDRDA